MNSPIIREASRAMIASTMPSMTACSSASRRTRALAGAGPSPARPPGRSSTTVMPRVIVPESSTSTGRSTPVKSSGATTDITAVASWIGAPLRPAISSARATAKSRRSAARVAAGPPAARMRSRSVAPIRTRWVTSSPTIVVIGNSRNTIAAASGSAHTLNSATAVTLPIWAPPPMIVNPPSRLGREDRGAGLKRCW